MRKGTDLVGQPIVDYSTGRKLTTVKDLIFSQDQSALVALLTEEPSWFSSGKVVLISHVQTIGPDAVLIKSADSIIPVDQAPSVQALISRENILRGTEIMTMGGRNLGKMIDLYFNSRTGNVEGYEVSGGLFADAYTGRSFVPSSETFRIGQEFAFVPHSVVDLMEEQVGGIKAAMEATGGKAKDIAQRAQTKAQELGHVAGQKADEVQSQAITAITDTVISPDEQKRFALGRTIASDVHHPSGGIFLQQNQTVIESDLERAESLGILDAVYRATGGDVTAVAQRKVADTTQQLSQAATDTVDRVKEQTKRAVAGYAVEETIGHRIQSMVRSNDGEIIAAPGQIVSQRIVEQALEYGEEKALINATGLSTREAAKRQSSMIAEDKIEQLQAGGEQMQRQAGQALDHANNALEWVKQTADDLFDKGTSEIEKRRIRGALGRPVNRVIFDMQDHVILNIGELVTHRAIKAARKANVLDILLDSIHNETPDISYYNMQSTTENGHKLLKSSPSS